MSRYECPECNGGFHKVPPEKECPWCGQKMDKSYSKTTIPASRTIDDIDSSDSGITLDLESGRAGTTPCPECGEPMPMVSWTDKKPKCQRCSDSTITTIQKGGLRF